MGYYIIKKIRKEQHKTLKGRGGDEWVIMNPTNKEEAQEDLNICRGLLVPDDEPVEECGIIYITLLTEMNR